MADHPFQPAVNDYGEVTDSCARCGMHRRTHVGAPVGVATGAGEAMTVVEVARAAGVSQSTVRSYRSRHLMPAPDGKLGNVPFWRPDTIGRWLATRSTRRGNPRLAEVRPVGRRQDPVTGRFVKEEDP